jgi:hypothetical protein
LLPLLHTRSPRTLHPMESTCKILSIILLQNVAVPLHNVLCPYFLTIADTEVRFTRTLIREDLSGKILYHLGKLLVVELVLIVGATVFCTIVGVFLAFLLREQLTAVLFSIFVTVVIVGVLFLRMMIVLISSTVYTFYCLGDQKTVIDTVAGVMYREKGHFLNSRTTRHDLCLLDQVYGYQATVCSSRTRKNDPVIVSGSFVIFCHPRDLAFSCSSLEKAEEWTSDLDEWCRSHADKFSLLRNLQPEYEPGLSEGESLLLPSATLAGAPPRTLNSDYPSGEFDAVDDPGSAVTEANEHETSGLLQKEEPVSRYLPIGTVTYVPPVATTAASSAAYFMEDVGGMHRTHTTEDALL